VAKLDALTLALCGDEWLASCCGCFTCVEKTSIFTVSQESDGWIPSVCNDDDKIFHLSEM
jgi:hypothetical protein